MIFATGQNPSPYEHYRFVADKGQGQVRVDKYSAMHIVGVSRNRIQQAAEANCILVNDNPVKSNYKIKPLDVISVVMDRPRRELEIIPEDIPLDVVYEDADLMVIKQSSRFGCASRLWQLSGHGSMPLLTDCRTHPE